MDNEEVGPTDRCPADDAGADQRRQGQGRRDLLIPSPTAVTRSRRPDRQVHHPRQGRDRPPPSCPTVLDRGARCRTFIEVEWESAPAQSYPIAIRVEAYDRTGLLNDITQVVAENKVNIVAAAVNVNPDHTAIVTATLQVASVSQLARVMSRIEGLKDVLSVQRDLG